MAAKSCAHPNCGAGKNHPVHSRWHKEHHAFLDASAPGLKPMSEGMRNFRKESGYDAAVREAKGEPCQVLSPVCTGYAEHLHEPLARGRAGGLKAALRDGPAPIPCCDPCNGYIGENQVWARENGFLVSRKDLEIRL
jgi:hypothetical protein